MLRCGVLVVLRVLLVIVSLLSCGLRPTRTGESPRGGSPAARAARSAPEAWPCGRAHLGQLLPGRWAKIPKGERCPASPAGPRRLKTRPGEPREHEDPRPSPLSMAASAGNRLGGRGVGCSPGGWMGEHDAPEETRGSRGARQG